MTTTTVTAPTLAAALACAGHGWHVFPLRPGDKRPALRNNWEGRATTDPTRIRRCWNHAPYNVGIACGPSGLIVVDLDTPKPGETPPDAWALPGVNEGADVLAVLCERHGEPFPCDTFTVTTRRGGMHLYFTAPPGTVLRNTSGRHRTGLGWLIDTRAHGGYVVAPGSYVELPDGAGAYRIANPAPPAPLPPWLARLLTTPPALLLGAPSVAGTVADLPAYVQAALKGEAERVADAVTGGRNHALNKAAYNLGRLAAAGALDADLAASVLYEAAAVHFCTGPNAFTPADARATIRSALAAGARNPRTITRGNAA
ncbi:bifunctional DNA primase/polymerase [Actinomadura nitritigenes]|uniref:bifunctional DNA primase/polymerase n=1 Tax=Actinomadura nitritigenes TaxID=134602 RepID=UPI003D8F1AD9